MHIRRLRLDSDDDSDEEQPDAPPQPQSATHQAPNPTNFPSEPLVISDEDFVDVSDDLSPPSPPPAPPPQPHAPACPVDDFLRRLGLGLKREWLVNCLRELQGSVRGFEGLDAAAKAKLCFEQFLFADMNFCGGGGMLPANVDSMHLSVLPGRYILQVDEILNMSCPLRGRYQKAPPGVKRCLKLSMTDGVQRVFGMEYRPIQALDVCAPSGLKVAISNVSVRRGLLMLVPETIQILGGLVEQLDAARKRLVEELNKPPRGKRTKNGVLPPLATRATRAAWPSSGADDPGLTGSIPHSTDPVHANNQGAGLNMSGAGNRLTTEDNLPMGMQNAASNSIPHTVSNAEARNMDVHRSTYPVSSASSMGNQFPSTFARAEVHKDTPNITRQNSVGNQSSRAHSNVEARNMDVHRGTYPVSSASSMANQFPSTFAREEVHIDTPNMTRQNSVGNQSSRAHSNVEARNMDVHRGTYPVSSASSMANQFPSTFARAEVHIDTPNITRQNSVGNQSSHARSNVEARNMDVHRGTYPVSSASSMANQFPSTFAREEVHIDTPNITRQNSVGNQSSHARSNVEARNMDVHRGTYPVSSASSMANQFPSTFARAKVHIDTPSSVASNLSPLAENVEADKDRNRDPVITITDNTPPRGFSSTVSRTDDILMGDASDHPLVLSGDNANITRESSVGNQFSHVHSNVAVADKDNFHVTRESSMASKCSPIAENVETNHDRIPVITITDNAPLRGSSTVSNTDDILMVDAASDHPLMMPGDPDVPFTYLASLSAKWASMKEKSRLVQGKIKCFLTGVKGFQYKRRTTYELQAYVDDGSLISEIIIDHDVVQKGIGYSPQEVTAALSSADMKTVQNMKDTMRKFQAFLANFEGVILVEFNRKSSIPLALEMNQGCPQSDAWLLMRRLKSPDPAQVRNHFPSDPIYLSP